MQAPEDIVYAEIGHDDAEKRQHHIEMIDLRTTEYRECVCMQNYGIYHEGDERPRLLRVPTPISSPTDVCPYSADEDAKTHGDDGWIEHQTTQQL